MSDATPLSDEAYEIMRVAVNLARNEQIRKLATLKRKLLAKFPGKEAQIKEALTAWAKYARRHSSD